MDVRTVCTGMRERAVLIGESVAPVALDAANAFWQSSLSWRASFVVLSTTTLGLLALTVVGGTGAFDM